MAASELRVSVGATTAAAASAAFFVLAAATPTTFSVLSSGPKQLVAGEAATATGLSWQLQPQLQRPFQPSLATASPSAVLSTVALTAVITVAVAAALRRRQRRGFAGAWLRSKPARTPTVSCSAKSRNKRDNEPKYKASFQNTEDGASLTRQFGDYNSQKEARQQSNVGASIVGTFEAEDIEEDAAAQDMEDSLDWNSDLGLETQELEEVSEEELARRGERQVSYTLYPSRQYTLYLAMKNAEMTWMKDDGRNRGCLEVQIAKQTERIRNMVMHMRENIHDYKCRLKLVSLVSLRRRFLDKLAWKDLNSYLELREKLQIRHVYRMEALIGRVPRHKYGIRDRKRAPGRKVGMRIKKRQRLLERRLANKIKQGKDYVTIAKFKSMVKSRKWIARPYDDVAAYLSGNDQGAGPKIDPLNVP